MSSYAADLRVGSLKPVLDVVDRQGHAVSGRLLSTGQCRDVVDMFDAPKTFRSTVDMDRHQFGSGVYRYFATPLPAIVDELRHQLYGPLAELANTWADRLGQPPYPPDLDGLHRRCADAGQHKPTPLLLRYGPSGYNCLHQDVYGDVTFPLQVAVMLSRPDRDFTGGESVFVEQRPRAQSRASVARPGQGEALVFAVRDRPVPGHRGYKRVAMRHGVSEVRSGERFVLGIIFHNAR